MTQFPTSIGTSTEDTISLLGHDLAGELLGRTSFSELAFWLLAGRRPSPDDVAVFDAVLVALTDHGFTPTAIAARSTYYSAPDSLQGALAAGLLGGGSRFLGVTEDTGAFLADALLERDTDEPIDRRGWAPGDWDSLASRTVSQARAAARLVPGLGHPVHKQHDPRTQVLIRLARAHGAAGEQVELFEAIGRVHANILGKHLPLNGAGAGGAILSDLGIRPKMLRGVALLARTAGLLGHLAEEQIRPVGPDIYSTVDRNATYVPIPH